MPSAKDQMPSIPGAHDSSPSLSHPYSFVFFCCSATLLYHSTTSISQSNTPKHQAFWPCKNINLTLPIPSEENDKLTSVASACLSIKERRSALFVPFLMDKELPQELRALF